MKEDDLSRDDKSYLWYIWAVGGTANEVGKNETKSLILANLYISGIMLVLSLVVTKFLLAGSFWLFLADAESGLPDWVTLLFGLPLFLLVWISVVRFVLGKMNYESEKRGEVYYFNMVISAAIFFGSMNL